MVSFYQRIIGNQGLSQVEKNVLHQVRKQIFWDASIVTGDSRRFSRETKSPTFPGRRRDSNAVRDERRGRRLYIAAICL